MILRHMESGDRMAEPRFEIFKDSKGEFRFRLIAPNGKTIATSEGYTSRAACLNGIESVKGNAPRARVEDVKEVSKK